MEDAMPNRYPSSDSEQRYQEHYNDYDRDRRYNEDQEYDDRPRHYRFREQRPNYEREENYSNRLTNEYEPDYYTQNRRVFYSSNNNQYSGVHRGKGPKGYTRSDERIKEDVSDALMEDPELDASDIEVTVKKGEVLLEGFVTNRNDKRRAEHCAELCAGIRDIQNNIKIRTASATSEKERSTR